MRNEVIRQRRIQHAGGIELFPRDRGSDHREDAGADYGANPKRRQRPGAKGLFQAVFGILGVQNQLVDGLAAQ